MLCNIFYLAQSLWIASSVTISKQALGHKLLTTGF
jgi:hypothetical protein